MPQSHSPENGFIKFLTYKSNLSLASVDCSSPSERPKLKQGLLHISIYSTVPKVITLMYPNLRIKPKRRMKSKTRMKSKRRMKPKRKIKRRERGVYRTQNLLESLRK